MAVIIFTVVKFTDWLDLELDNRGWTRAELARRANVNQSTISMVYSGQREVGPDLAKSIARALHLPAEAVFREAGLLPPASDKDDPVVRELEYLVGQLSEDKKQIVVDYVRFLVEMEEKKGKGRK